MSFENIVGNDKVKTFLNRQIKENQILHSYLFVGIEGIGKTLFAREYAKKILCLNKEETEDCISCIKWESNNHPDFYQIEPENKTIKIDQIRKMQEKISEKPITSNRKVYLIIDSDCMTKEAQNCLLKTLEEPPEYSSIILTTSNESKLINTIKSRCMKISFESIEQQKIEQYLKENLEIEPSKELINLNGGSIGRAIMLEQDKEIYMQVNNIINNIEKQDLITTLNNSELLYKEKEKIQEILEYINIFLFNTKDIKKINCIQHVEEVKKRIISNCNYDMCIDYLLMNLYNKINNVKS